MNYLLVVAHPDDEVLGAGASLCKFAERGDNVDVCIMSADAAARAFRPENKELSRDTKAAMDFLNIRKTFYGDFPNIQMNTTPHLQLVQFIEKAIVESEADVVITHHPADTNNDHIHTSAACQAAIRIFQRRQNVKGVKELWFTEILSSTEWSLDSSSNAFSPNLFIEVGKKNVEKKIEALSLYRGVMRDYPHPRSREAMEGLAAYRGAQSGCNYAEAFECVFRRVL